MCALLEPLLNEPIFPCNILGSEELLSASQDECPVPDSDPYAMKTKQTEK